MVKKSLMVGLGFLLLGGLVLGRNTLSYLRTSVSCVQDRIHENVPVSFELERARRMIEDLKPEIQQNMHRIAREEVEVAQLERQLSELEGRQAETKQAVLRFKGDLESGKSTLVYGSKSYSVSHVRNELANRFAKCKTLDETIANLQKVLEFRKSGLQSGRQKLDELLTVRDQLKLDVEGLEARRKMIEVQQTASDLKIDDSQLARTKELVSNIQTRLNVTERLLATSGDLVAPQIELEAVDNGDLLQQVAAYFGEKPATSPAAAVEEPASVAEVEQLAEVVTP